VDLGLLSNIAIRRGPQPAHLISQRDAAPREPGLFLDSIAIKIALLTELDPASEKSQRVRRCGRPLSCPDFAGGRIGE
jgi:hypothetical protein